MALSALAQRIQRRRIRPGMLYQRQHLIGQGLHLVSGVAQMALHADIGGLRAQQLILSANAAQVSDPAFAAELKSWLRFNASAAIETGDGLYSACSGNPTLPTFLGRIMFDRFFTVRAENDRYARQLRSSAGLRSHYCRWLRI